MAYLPSALSSLRQEVQDYLRSAEYLISSIAHGDHPRLTEMERDLVEFYSKELVKLVAPAVTS